MPEINAILQVNHTPIKFLKITKGEGIKEPWYTDKHTHTMEYYSAIKKE